MSGEAEARTDLGLPGEQEQIIKAVKATGKPFAVVLFNGRPLVLSRHRRRLAGDPGSVVRRHRGRQRRRRRRLRQGQPRRQAAGELPAQRGPGADLLQRPADRPPVRPGVPLQLAPPRHQQLRAAVRVRLRPQLHDLQGLRPDAVPPMLDARRGTVNVTVDVTNTGAREGDDVVQLYIRDPVASLSQPVRRLRGFQRVTLGAGQVDDGQLDAQPRGRRVLRQPRALPRRERADRGLRGDSSRPDRQQGHVPRRQRAGPARGGRLNGDPGNPPGQSGPDPGLGQTPFT